MRRISLSTICLLLAACGASQSPGGSDLAVRVVLLGAEVNARQEITEERVVFHPDDAELHAHAFVENVRVPTSVLGQWWYEPQERKIFETAIRVTPQAPVAKFVLSNNQDWPPGRYRFVVLHEGEVLVEKTVSVEPEETAEE